jgi:hypothetical protein
MATVSTSLFLGCPTLLGKASQGGQSKRADDFPPAEGLEPGEFIMANQTLPPGVEPRACWSIHRALTT